MKLPIKKTTHSNKEFIEGGNGVQLHHHSNIASVWLSSTHSLLFVSFVSVSSPPLSTTQIEKSSPQAPAPL